MRRFDAVIAGGGVAGSTTAAALAGQGLEVLVCEAGLPSERRLAGELMHPPAARDLDELGLLAPLQQAGGVPAYGFGLFQNAEDDPTVLSYSEVPGGRPTGLAIEHGVMAQALLSEVGRRKGVTVWQGARVLGPAPDGGSLEVEGPGDAGAADLLVRRGKEEVQVRAPLVVSAEGRSSALRDGAGIRCEKGAPFRMLGFKVFGGRLPLPGYGHVFVGGSTPSLAYQVGRDEVRVMFERPPQAGLEVPEELLLALPQPFRDDVRAAMAEQTPQVAKVYGLSPHRAAAGRVAVVGDAGGCVHPLTASGISFCTRDARSLAAAVGAHYSGGRGVARTLRRYQRLRSGPMRTRVALGPALVEALSCGSPEMRLLRHGLFRYWERSQRGRGASLGLLSTQQSGMPLMAREYLSVCYHALNGVVSGVVRSDEIGPALVGLAGRSSHYLGHALGTL